jgi:hypothetical protein
MFLSFVFSYRFMSLVLPDGDFSANQPFDLEDHWHRSAAEPELRQDARLLVQAECRSYMPEKPVQLGRFGIGVFVEFVKVVFPSTGGRPVKSAK